MKKNKKEKVIQYWECRGVIFKIKKNPKRYNRETETSDREVINELFFNQLQTPVEFLGTLIELIFLTILFMKKNKLSSKSYLKKIRKQKAKEGYEKGD